MKKVLASLFSVVVVLSMMSCVAFATEAESNDALLGTTAATDVATSITTGIEPATGVGDPVDEVEEAGYSKAKVTKVGDVTEEDLYGIYKIKMQTVTIEFLTGKHKGEEHEISFYITQDYNGLFEAAELAVGDVVYAGYEEASVAEDGTAVDGQAFVVQKIKSTNMLVLAIIMAIIIIAIARFAGVKTVLLVIANTAIVLAVVLGMYMTGVNAILSIIVLILALILANGLILNGPKKETWVAMLAVLVSTTITMGAFTLINSWLGNIGLTEYASYLSGLQDPSVIKFDYLDVIVAGVITMTMGIAMDMALRSVRKSQQGKTFTTTIKEISNKLASKINIVFLAWIGTFFPMFIVYLLFQRPMLEILNVETIVIELLKIMIIFLNAVIVIPITVLLSKELLKVRTIGDNKEKEKEEVK